MRCERCNEDDFEMIFLGECRRCNTISLKEEREWVPERNEVSFDINLTKAQKLVSDSLIQSIEHGDVFIDAVCGAGKTEICLELVKDMLQSGKRVGWAIPRREVVLELSTRLSRYFNEYEVVPVCQGYTQKVIADLIVCTTHQLFRYENYFDLLILDEPDAFPYAGNSYLESIMKSSCRGSIVYLSATFEIKNVTRLTLPIRPSLKLLPEPVLVKTRFPTLNLINLLLRFRKEHCLIFVPTKKIAKKLSMVLNIPFICSSSNNKSEILLNFKKTRGLLITTTVLERGVTFIDCFVFVYHAQHRVFTEGSLVQIAGRAMRGMNPLKGGVWFICLEQSDAIKECMKRILKANKDAQYVLSQN